MNAAARIARAQPRGPGSKHAAGAGVPDPLRFELPDGLSATAPPEARGIARDGVRLMVSDTHTDQIEHAIFRDLPRYLCAGDLLVVNQSATLAAALHAWWEPPRLAGPVELHLSTPIPGGTQRQWAIELREVNEAGSAPLLWAEAGDVLRLEAGGRARLIEPYVGARPGLRAAPRAGGSGRVRLWAAELTVPGGVLEFARRHGAPIRYRYVSAPRPLADYQTVFATEPGSAEMPSAGRPFTPAVLARLEQARVPLAPIVLHTGVASLDAGESPYPERYRVPRRTAAAVNATRARGGRVIAVGTTVVRALETAASPNGRIHASGGWTHLVITPERGVRSVDGILTGLHEPTSSHLGLLEAFAGRAHLERAYAAALHERYLWHEFGDLHLMLR
jgi:S-adenosylmethionine:tRNA ribosyltransferase-isomerase